MIEEELKRIDESARRNALNIEEMDYLKLLLLRWMYEQGVLQRE